VELRICKKKDRKKFDMAAQRATDEIKQIQKVVSKEKKNAAAKAQPGRDVKYVRVLSACLRA
jgi:hypothetical protein